MIGFPISRFLSYPISFLLPGYRSFKAVLSDGGDDDTMWLCYWLICAFLLAFESLCSFIVASFPFYFELKCVVLCFLQADTTKLSFQLFNKFIEPLLTSVEPQIDAFLDKYSQQAVSITHSANEQLHKEIANIAVQQALEKMNS